jgi:hypothetical protein
MDLSIREDPGEALCGQAAEASTLPRRIAAEAGLCGVRPAAILSGPNKMKWLTANAPRFVIARFV